MKQFCKVASLDLEMAGEQPYQVGAALVTNGLIYLTDMYKHNPEGDIYLEVLDMWDKVLSTLVTNEQDLYALSVVLSDRMCVIYEKKWDTYKNIFTPELIEIF